VPFIDDNSIFTHVYSVKHKSDAFFSFFRNTSLSNGTLKEVYMRQPDGFVEPKSEIRSVNLIANSTDLNSSHAIGT